MCLFDTREGEAIMGINSVEGSAANYAVRRAASSPERELGAERMVTDEEVSTETVAAPEPPSVAEPTGDVRDGAGAEGRARGVLRRLQAGHFRGVADVRLRINFWDELRAAQGAELRQEAEATTQRLTETVTAALDAAAQEDALPPEAMAAVGELADALGEEVRLAAGDVADAGGFVADVREAFARFTQGVSTLLAEGEEAPDEPVTLPGFLDDLERLFGHQMEEFRQTAPRGDGLPPLSPPQGNGGAYQRFLAIYSSLLGLPADEQEAPAETGTDISA